MEFTNSELAMSNGFRECQELWCFPLFSLMRQVKPSLVRISGRQQCVIWIRSSVGSIEGKSALEIVLDRV